MRVKFFLIDCHRRFENVLARALDIFSSAFFDELFLNNINTNWHVVGGFFIFTQF